MAAKLRNLLTDFQNAVRGGEVALRVNTDEQEDAIATIHSACKKFGWEMRVWDHATGTVWHNLNPPEWRKKKASVPSGAGDFLNQLGAGVKQGSFLAELQELLADPPQPEANAARPVITIFRNFHLAFGEQRGQVVSTIQHIISDRIKDHPKYDEMKRALAEFAIEPDSDTGKFIIGFMPEEASLPPEIKPLFKVITHELPDETELLDILNGVSVDEPISSDDAKKIVKFALGLTRLQAEGVFGACSVEHKTVLPDYVWREKSAILNKEGLVELYQGKEKFDDVAGLTGAKDMIMRLLTPDEFDDKDPDCRAKGLLFVGPPGVGKSLIAKAAGNELGLPTLFVQPGNWMGGIVGETEAKTRKGFQIVRRHAPCIAVIDEIEKVMPSSRGGDHDGGVGARMEGTFLTNLNDIQEQVFWCFTANDVQRMHEAFFRAERVDAVFYVSLPTGPARSALWKLYLNKFFPAQIDGKRFPRHMELNLKSLQTQYKAVRDPDDDVWIHKFAAVIMCLPPDNRETAIAAVAKNTQLDADAIKAALVHDDGWTPAEIRACCRLSRRLQEPLARTQNRVRPVSVTASKVIQRLERWAENAALDAETGETYVVPAETAALVAEMPSVKHPGGRSRVRRKVRSIGDSDE